MEQIRETRAEDENYPKLLKEIPGSPKVLYYKGKIKNENPFFAIVGTRRCSSYGKQIAIEIAGRLSEAGLVVVSGLAPGIDTFVHKAVLEKGGVTFSVLGTGLDESYIYPKENVALAKEISQSGGCLISEYPPKTSGNRFTFPNRNRIISGLSLGVLVIEAKKRSGALITANYAFLQNRKVFAVPGSIYSQNSKGPHNLIKKGAKLVDNAQDILEELNITAKTDSDRFKIKTENKSSKEQLVMDAMKEEALHIDKIIEKTKLNPAIIASALTILEMEGKIRNLGGNIYALSR